MGAHCRFLCLAAIELTELVRFVVNIMLVSNDVYSASFNQFRPFAGYSQIVAVLRFLGHILISKRKRK